MEFPEWINKYPREVWNDASSLLICIDFSKKKFDRMESRLIARKEILEKCILAVEAKKIWLDTSQYFECNEKGQLWLSCVIQESIAEPDINAFRKSAKEVQAWEREVHRTAIKLGDLLHNAPEQRYDAYYQFTWRIMDALLLGYDDHGSHVNGFHKRMAMHAETSSPNQIGLVEKISDDVNSLIYRTAHHFTTKKAADLIAEIAIGPKIPSIWGRKVRGSYADRAYFVRALTVAYLLKTKKPHRAEIAALANIAYPSERAEQALSEREVIRLTKDLMQKSSDFAYMFSSIESTSFPYYERACSG